MNVSPVWLPRLRGAGYDAHHWSQIGQHDQWARENDFVVITHDLDFGAILATTEARGPSDIQIRVQDVLSESTRRMLQRALDQFELETGALITIDTMRMRARILPLRKS